MIFKTLFKRKTKFNICILNNHTIVNNFDIINVLNKWKKKNYFCLMPTL